MVTSYDSHTERIIQGAVALAIIVGAFVISGILLIQNRPITDVMAVMGILVSPIAAFFFAQRAVIAGVNTATNGMAQNTRQTVQTVLEHQNVGQPTSPAGNPTTSVGDHQS